MQKDSTSDHMKCNQAVNQESQIKSFPCSHCTLVCSTEGYLFDHLNEKHGLHIDAALKEVTVKTSNNTSTGDSGNSSESNFQCKRCDFKACTWYALKEHEKRCGMKAENQNLISDLTNQHSHAAGASEASSVTVMPTSKAKCTFNSTKDLKKYKSSPQTITKYFQVSSGDTPVKLDDNADCTKGTPSLQESPLGSSPTSSGSYKVTAAHPIDVSKTGDHLVSTGLRPAKPKEQFNEFSVGKRISDDCSESSPAKKARLDKDTKLQGHPKVRTQQASGGTEFELSEDEVLVNGDAKSPNVYVCKQCDFSDASVRRLSTHYEDLHPFVRCNTAYIRDPSDQSATFRCLECPVEFLSISVLKRHYAENHPDAPNVFQRQVRELCLVFKCFVCHFSTNTLASLKKHYQENHPTHEMDNSLMFCRYSATRFKNGSAQMKTCEKALSPERPREISNESTQTPCKEVKNAPSPQQASLKGADVTLYQCNNCPFSHKSVVVLHVHYQKSHPHEVVTIDKIKQSACVTLHKSLQMTPDKSPRSAPVMEQPTPRKNISDCEEKRNKAEFSQEKEISASVRNPKHTPRAFKSHSPAARAKIVEAAKDRSMENNLSVKYKKEMSAGMDTISCSSPNELFYCQFCSYSSVNIKSVLGHHNAKHTSEGPTDINKILRHKAKILNKKLRTEAEASTATTSPDSKTCEQVEVCSENKGQRERGGGSHPSAAGCNAYARAEKLFYCQKCNYGNTSAQGVLNHQAKVHHSIKTNLECIVGYTALIRDQIGKTKSHAKKFPFSTNLPLPLLIKANEAVFFCHFCNYRQSTVKHLLKHYIKNHRGFVVTAEEIQDYTSMVLAEIKKSHLEITASQEREEEISGHMNKKIKPGKVSATQARLLQCYRCTYNTQYIYLLRRHMWKIHKSNRSTADLLKVCFRQGYLQAGYHCDLCVFSDQAPAVVFKHYQEHHPERNYSLENVTNRLYVGAESSSRGKNKPHLNHAHGTSNDEGTEGSAASLRSGQDEGMTYSCRACSFKCSSVSSITQHYRAVHPWSVKDDGSVMYLINGKKPNANKQVEDQNEMPFDSYQAPLEFESPPDSFPQAAAHKKLKCHFCSATFTTHHGLRTHSGMKHPEVILENLDEQQEETMESQPRVHLFKCPHCTYVNTNHHGVLTHCQMKHPARIHRANSLYVVEAHVLNSKACVKGKGQDLKFCGYMCKTCPQFCATTEKLSKHMETHEEAGTEPDEPESPPQPSAVSLRKQYKTLSSQGPVSKASFLSKKKYAMLRCQFCTYRSSTKIGLTRHAHLHHKVQDGRLKCALCLNLYFEKARLGNHYLKKHGKKAYLRYFAPAQESEKAPPLGSTSEACESSTTAGEDQKTVYKCRTCPYVNESYQGTLTHCQMMHPAVLARADDLQTTQISLSKIVNCGTGIKSNVRGYLCKICRQVLVSLKRLKTHCDRDHGRPLQASESETEDESNSSSQGSAFEDVSPNLKTSAAKTEENDFKHQSDSPETCESNTPAAQGEKTQYKCSVCAYSGSCRKYLYCHYTKTHKFDTFTTYKLLEKYSKRSRKRPRRPSEANSEPSAHVRCKLCPRLKFVSSLLLIEHYRTHHNADRILDFVVLSQPSKKTTGLYKCTLCPRQLNGMRKLCQHLDCHRDTERKMSKAGESKPVRTQEAPEPKPAKPAIDEVPVLDTVEDLAQWYMAPVETFTMPSPLSSPLTAAEEPELQSRKGKLTCTRCLRSFMSLKGLRSHERSHAAVVAIKKLNNLSTSAIKHNIEKYVLYKAGTVRPFLCSCCSFRTTVMGLWKRHFMKKHRDVVLDPVEMDNQAEESAQSDKEPVNSEEANSLPELDDEAEITGKSLYLEPPDVQRQLDHYSLMAQAGASSKAGARETRSRDNRLLHCEVCNFNTEHLSSIRRHYLNRHGKKILRCKDCDFFTGLRKTLELHMEMGHSTCQSEPTHQKDLRCPFCLYQTKNKNNMIDHIVLHREERVVPIEVRRSKLSRYLRGVVFRCHKCTFTSGSAENLRLHTMKHDDVKPYRCRLCYFDCTRLSDLEAHLSDKHQVVRNHELVGQVSLDQMEARDGRSQRKEDREREEPLSDMERASEDIKTEEFVTDCDEVPHETPTNNLEIPAESSALDLQCGKSNSVLLDQKGRGLKDRGETMFLSNTERRRQIGNAADRKTSERNGADIRVDFPAKDGPTKVNQVQPKCRDSQAQRKMAEEAADQKHMKGFERRTASFDTKTEDGVPRHDLLLDEDGGVRRKTDPAPMVKTEPDVESEDEDNVLNEPPPPSSGEEGRKKRVHAESISRHVQTHAVRAAERRTDERRSTLGPNCGQLKTRHKRNEKRAQNGRVRDAYGDMPVLENECLKEEAEPLSCCKEEDESERVEQRQGEEDEAMKADKSRRSCAVRQEGGGAEEAESPLVTKGALAVTDEATTKEKPFTCKFCGRDLMNGSELERHITRHGI